jgi:hypothetical protein
MTVVCASQQVNGIDPESVDVALVAAFAVALAWRSHATGTSADSPPSNWPYTAGHGLRLGLGLGFFYGS